MTQYLLRKYVFIPGSTNQANLNLPACHFTFWSELDAYQLKSLLPGRVFQTPANREAISPPHTKHVPSPTLQSQF